MADADTSTKKSDLPTRAISAVVMLLVAGGALWIGGWVWAAFVAAVALGVLWEWWELICAFVPNVAGRAVWLLGGFIYIGLAALMLFVLRVVPLPLGNILLFAIILAVIGTDVGAYFSGRTFGGPKIAPKISPSKTWSGLAGGLLGAAIALVLVSYHAEGFSDLGLKLLAGAMIAVIAQSGDFFESWMKRRAGVKDASNLIPGHGGLFDRADGLLAVSFVLGLIAAFNFVVRP